MSKTGTISSYINKCDTLLSSDELNEIKEFIDEVICVYQKEIKGFTERLYTTSAMRMYEKININQAKSDLKNIKAMLINYKDNIKSGLIPSNNNSGISIQNIASAEATSNVNLTFEQIIHNINDLSTEVLSDEAKEELEDKLRSLESVINSGNKENIDSKLKRLLNFSLEKGPAVIALVSKAISLFSDKILPLFTK